jgi:hypothetical protein
MTPTQSVATNIQEVVAQGGKKVTYGKAIPKNRNSKNTGRVKRRFKMASKNGALAKNNPARMERDRTIAEERLKGKTYRELSEQFGLSKSVLHRILNDDEIRDVIETATSHMVSLVPKALDNYQELLDSKDEKVRLQASKDCLQTTSIMPSHTQSPVMINILNQQVNPSQTAELAQIAAFLASQWQSVVTDNTPDNKAGEGEASEG